MFLAFFVNVEREWSSDKVHLTASGPGDEDEGSSRVKWYLNAWSHGCFIHLQYLDSLVGCKHRNLGHQILIYQQLLIHQSV